MYITQQIVHHALNVRFEKLMLNVRLTHGKRIN